MGQKYQKEIEEILEKVNAQKGAPAHPERRAHRTTAPVQRVPPPPPSGRRTWRVSPSRTFLLAVLLLIAALILSVNDQSRAASISAWVGIVLFVVAYVSFFTEFRRGHERRWRGRILDDVPGSSPGALRRWWRWLTGR